MLFPTLVHYDPRRQFLGDVVAGLTVGALAVPQSLSYAKLCGLQVQAGLYSDLQVAYPVIGSSRYLVVGPVAVMSLMVHAALQSDGVAQEFTLEWAALASLLCVLVGSLQFLVALAGGGTRLSTLLPESAIKGFTAAAALTILGTQVPELTGTAKCAGGCGVFRNYANPFLTGGPLPKAVLASLLSLCVLEGFRFVPGPVVSKLGALVVICSGVALEFGFGPLGLDTVGAIPQNLPEFGATLSSAGALQDLPWRTLNLCLRAVPIALVGFAEAFAIARANAAKYDRGATPLALHPDRELAALASANVWTGLLGGFPVTGSFSRSAVNADAGATSAASPIVAAFFVAAVLRFFTGWLALLPRACVASVVVSAVLRLLDVGFLSSVCRGALAPRERLLYLTVLVAGVGLGIEAGLASGAILGFVLNTWFPVAPQTSAALGGDSHM